MDKIVYLHENMSKVDIKYNFSLGLPPTNQDPAEQPNPDDVVALDWRKHIKSVFQIESFNQFLNQY